MATLRVDVVHTGLDFRMPELTFSGEKSVAEVKENLYRRTGTKSEDMELWLVDPLGRKIQHLLNAETKLSDVIPPEAELGGWSLHIVDKNPQSLSATRAIFEDSVPKYEAPHGRKEFTEFRKAKRIEQSGSSNPAPSATTGLQEAAEFDDDDRVVLLKDGLKGTVRYIGKCSQAAPGFFIGVELDECKGKHDGTVKGKQLFSCKPGHGILVRPFALRKMRFADLGDNREEL